MNDFDGIPICGVVAAELGAMGKWPGPNPRLPYFLNTTGYAGSLTAAQLRSAFAEAIGEWSKHIEFDPVPVATTAEALIRAHFAFIDGSSGVLAWSHLANNTNSPKEQRYDTGEKWIVVPPTATPTGGIDFRRVAIHELGHMLGLGHDASNADAILRPTYSSKIGSPTKRDIDRMVGLGYKRRATAPPPPPSPPAGPGPDPDPPPVDPPPGERVEVDVARKIVSAPAAWTVVKH